MSQFGHETLNVYQESIRFITWINELLETIPKNLSVHNQLDRASTSIPLNIAEGNGKYHLLIVADISIVHVVQHLNALLAWTFLSLRKRLIGTK